MFSRALTDWSIDARFDYYLSEDTHFDVIQISLYTKNRGTSKRGLIHELDPNKA